MRAASQKQPAAGTRGCVGGEIEQGAGGRGRDYGIEAVQTTRRVS
jgi:hypothetical protein